jgi:hypothetical protein
LGGLKPHPGPLQQVVEGKTVKTYLTILKALNTLQVESFLFVVILIELWVLCGGCSPTASLEKGLG